MRYLLLFFTLFFFIVQLPEDAILISNIMVIILFSIAFILTVILLLIDLDDDPDLHVASRFRIKGLWYSLVVISTVINTFIGASTPFNLVLIFIVAIEAVDNYKSYYVNKKSNTY